MIKINDQLVVDRIESVELVDKSQYVVSPSLFCGGSFYFHNYVVQLNSSHNIYQSDSRKDCEEWLDNFIKEHNLDEHS